MDMKLTKRVDINLGYSCNEKCKFCYYLKSVEARDQDKDLTTVQAKRVITYIKKRGAEILDFTGGEPTIRKDFIELVEYAKKIGFKSLSLITNGIVLSKKEYAQKVVNAGIDDFLFSLHGTSSQTHDYITGFDGSFELMLKAIANIHEVKGNCNIKLRSNTVVCGTNYDKIDDSLGLLHSLNFDTVNFILFNPIVEADTSNREFNVEYSLAAPHLMAGIDKYADKIKKLTVRYMPFCLMPGYEKYITNMPQIQYDSDEWDYLIRTRIREGFFASTAALCAGMILHPSYKRLFKIGCYAAKREGIKRFLEVKNKVKGNECKKCSLIHICDGLWKEYAKWKGFDELKAVQGEKISDPVHFLKERDNNTK